MKPQVTIVGCGPVGALAANLLGSYGVPTLVLEREAAEYHLPRAAHFDGEVMRIFQAAGLHTEFDGVVRSFDGMDLVSAKGRPLMQFRTTAQDRTFGHPVANLFYQPELERVLRRGMARFDCVELRSLAEVESLEQSADGVRVTMTDRSSGTQSIIETDYVLGCDGGRSLTRKSMASSMDDLGLHQPWLVIDLLMKREVNLPDIAIQVCDPKRPATLIPFPAPRRRWEFMLMPGEEPEHMTSTETIERLLKPWVTPADYDIERAAVYTFHGLIARPWRRGRLFLLGDAAHQMPPFLGQGMCAGIRDAFNLCWKLEHILKHGANPSLLDTYESERYPHVEAVIKLAIRLGRIIQSKNWLVGAFRNLGFRLAGVIGGGMSTPASASTLHLGPGFFDRGSANRAKPIPFPQPRVEISGGPPKFMDECIGEGFALLVLDRDARSVISAELARRADDAAIRMFRVGESAPVPGMLADTESRLRDWFKKSRTGAALLRPDRVPYGAYALPETGPCEALNSSLMTILAVCGNPGKVEGNEPNV